MSLTKSTIKKHTALGTDLWAPRELAKLTPTAISELRNIYQQIEERLEWPTQLLINFVIFDNTLLVTSRWYYSN